MDETVKYPEGTIHATGIDEGLREKHMLELIAGGSFAEMAGGIGAVVLAILGLVGIIPTVLAAIAVISIGAAIFVEGISVTMEYKRLFNRIAKNNVYTAELTGGISAAVFGGAAGIVLGILSILSVYPLVLLPIAAIVLGTGIAFGSGIKARLHTLKVCESENTLLEKVAKNAVITSIGADIIIGISAIVLGILALVGLVPGILTLVAMLILGGAIMLGGSAMGSEMVDQTRCLANNK